MREENTKIEVVVWRLGREKAAEPRRCRRRIQRERTKKKAEGGGRVFSGERDEGGRHFKEVKGKRCVWLGEIRGGSLMICSPNLP